MLDLKMIHLKVVSRRIRLFFLKKKLKNRDFSIISNNCIGGCLYHDFNIRFNSPTINLYIKAEDYIYFLENLKEILEEEIIDITEKNDYPIGRLGNKINIYFLHYNTFNSAISKWAQRRKRINFKKLYIIFIERDGSSYELLERFDALPYKHKIAIVHKHYKNIKCEYVIKGFENEKEVGNIMLDNGFLGKKIYDQVDWISFFNNKR